MRRSLYRALALLFAAALPAFAADGVIEINQAKALAGGVTAGDTAGFPVTISQTGSYRLTSNLDLTVLGLPASSNTDAITTPYGIFVTIDLNGFSILGPAVAGTGSGISGGRAVVRNGAIRGVGAWGIYLDEGVVEGISTSNNGSAGIFVTIGTVTRCSAIGNGGYGIGGGILDVDFCLSSGNQYGIQVDDGLVSRSVSRNNLISQLMCGVECALNANKFSGCIGAECFSGPGTHLQVPPASNMCGNVVCP